MFHAFAVPLVSDSNTKAANNHVSFNEFSVWFMQNLEFVICHLPDDSQENVSSVSGLTSCFSPMLVGCCYAVWPASAPTNYENKHYLTLSLPRRSAQILIFNNFSLVIGHIRPSTMQPCGSMHECWQLYQTDNGLHATHSDSVVGAPWLCQSPLI